MKFARVVSRRFCLVLGLIAIAQFGCTKKKDASDAQTVNAQGAEILIGEYGSFTGSEATFGTSTHNGAQMAVDEINAAGGIKGKKLKLIYYDDQGKAEEAAAAVTRLITKDKVVAIIGEVASTRSLAAAPIAQSNKIPMISPSSTNPKVTEVGDYIFRVCFIDPFQGTVMALFATNELKAKKVAILRDTKSDYSMGLADFFIKKFQDLGGKIVADESYESGAVEYRGQLTKIKAAKPDAIFVPGYYTEVGLIALQARQLGIKAHLLGGDGWDSSKLFEIGKAAINGSFFSNHYTTETTDPLAKDFIKKFQEKFKETPDGLAALGYDSIKVLAFAMNATTEITPANIRNELAKIKDYPAVTGVITIDEKRNAKKSAVVVRVDGTVNRYVTTIKPD